MVIVQGSKIILKDYEKSKLESVEKMLSVWDKATFKYIWANYVYNEEEKELILPSGIHPFFLSQQLECGVEYDNSFDEYKTAIFKSNYEPRDENQKEAIDFLLSLNQYQDLSKRRTRMLCLKTGAGKTFCTIYTLSKLKMRSIILVDQEKLMKQWKEEFVKFTTLSENDIYFISGSESIENILTAKKDLNYRIFIASHRTISNFANKNGWEKVTELFELLRVGIKVIDEAHVEFRNIFMIDAYTNTYQTIYLTATPGRSDPEEDKVYRNSFKHTPKYGLEEKFDNNYHNIYYISYNSKPSLKEQATCQSNRGFDVNKFYDYIFDNEEKYEQFFSIITSLLDMVLKNIKEENKVALLIHKIDHVKKLKEDLTERYPDRTIGTFCGLISNAKKRQEELNKQIIISTDKSLGKGIDVAGLQYLLMTVPTSSKIVSEQVLGRLRKIEGKKVFYFDITDIGFPACQRQRSSRQQLLNKKAISIKKLNI